MPYIRDTQRQDGAVSIARQRQILSRKCHGEERALWSALVWLQIDLQTDMQMQRHERGAHNY